MQVFSIPIDLVEKENVIQQIKTTKHALWIVTVNPEILLAAKKDSSYAHTLQQADLRLVDGAGLQFMLKFSGISVSRWPGIDMAKEIINIAKENNWRVAFLGGEKNHVYQAKKNIEKEFDLTIYAEQGGNVTKTGEEDEVGEEARHRLTLFDPEILFVAFGHPKQEQWIVKHAHEFPHLKVIIGVGGSFDIWAGILKRAPNWMQEIGIEWLWRLIQQPSRIKRIIQAVVIFPCVFFIDRLKQKHPSS